jgi:ATP-binding protein involved in chromosome partitioning
MQNGIPFLGEIPLSSEICAMSDAGSPVVESAPNSPSAQAFMSVAKNLAAQISIQNSGAISDIRPEPIEVARPSKTEIYIKWKDGHVSRYTGQQLRRSCSCAQCIDEMSGKPLLDPSSVSEDLFAQSVSPVGRYAFHFDWSDGHASGIYTFERLRALCGCEECLVQKQSSFKNRN